MRVVTQKRHDRDQRKQVMQEQAKAKAEEVERSKLLEAIRVCGVCSCYMHCTCTCTCVCSLEASNWPVPCHWMVTMWRHLIWCWTGPIPQGTRCTLTLRTDWYGLSCSCIQNMDRQTSSRHFMRTRGRCVLMGTWGGCVRMVPGSVTIWR